MAGITLILSAFDRNLVLSFGAETQTDDELSGKEVIVVESSGETQIAQVGFRPNDEDEEE